MPRRDKPKFKGWINPKDVAPELIDKIIARRERLAHYLSTIRAKPPQGIIGTNNISESHAAADADVPMTKEEKEIAGRIHSDALTRFILWRSLVHYNFTHKDGRPLEDFDFNFVREHAGDFTDELGHVLSYCVDWEEILEEVDKVKRA